MAFIDELLESGGNFILERSGSSASFAPVSDKLGDRRSFQALVARLRKSDGSGYRIVREELAASYRDQELVVLVLVDLNVEREERELAAKQ